MSSAIRHDPDDMEAAFEKALRVLNAASQTTSGLSRRLQRAGFSARASAEACRRAARLGYIDDRAYAEALVRRRLGQGRGRSLIGRELGQKGVDGELVGEVFGELGRDDELIAAVEAATRLVRRHATETPERRAQKVLAALGRRGFRGGTSREALRRALEASGEPAAG